MSDDIHFIKSYRSVAKYLGPEASLLLGELSYEQDYYTGKNKLNNYGYFTSTVDNITIATGLKKRKQLTAISKLEQYEIIDKYIHGEEKDTRRYFRVNRQKLKAFDDYCNTLGDKPLVYDNYVDYIQVAVMAGKYNGTNCTYNGSKKSIFNINNGTNCTNIQNDLNHIMEQNEPYYGTKCSTNKNKENIREDYKTSSASYFDDDGWNF